MKKDYIAKLTIEEMPRTKASHKRLVEWLFEKAAEVRDANPDDYAKPWNARLMK